MNKHEIPAGLSLMLRDFTVAVLRQKPSDLYLFAADYFQKLSERNRNNNISSNTNNNCNESEQQASKPKKIAMFVIVDNDSEACEPDPSSFQPKPLEHANNNINNNNKKNVNNNNYDDDDLQAGSQQKQQSGFHKNFGRRRSVAAERYDPEEDEDDDNDDANRKVMHPKTDEQRKRLKEAVQGILLFRSLAPEQMNDVIDAMFERNVDPGDHVIEQGDDGDNFYVIDCGVYDVYVKNETSHQNAAQAQPVPQTSSNQPTSSSSFSPSSSTSSSTPSSSTSSSLNKFVHRFEHSGSFGELALMYNMPRSATVVAVTKGRLWAMDRKSFRRIVLRSACKQRKTYESLLEKVPMLQHLDLYERMNLADALTPVYVNDGEMIIKEGDVADGMYFIEHGEVKVTITRNGVECEAARMQAGDYFGEMALVEKAPRSASVYSSGGGTTKLAFLEVDCFERLLGPCLEIMKRNITNYVKSS